MHICSYICDHIYVYIGMEILGLPFSEAKLLAIAYSYDVATKVRIYLNTYKYVYTYKYTCINM
jgi:hypothetical protein